MILAAFRHSHADRSVRLEWYDVDALTRRFELGELDIVFSLDDSGLGVSRNTNCVQVASCRLVLAAARNDPAWQEEDLSAFSGRTFFYEQEASPETTNEMRCTLAELLQQAGIQQPRIELVPNIQSRQTAVELGLGCCLSVDLDTLCASPLVRACPLDRPPSCLSCYWLREADKPIVPEFIRAFKRYLADDGKRGASR